MIIVVIGEDNIVIKYSVRDSAIGIVYIMLARQFRGVRGVLRDIYRNLVFG